MKRPKTNDKHNIESKIITIEIWYFIDKVRSFCLKFIFNILF